VADDPNTRDYRRPGIPFSTRRMPSLTCPGRRESWTLPSSRRSQALGLGRTRAASEEASRSLYAECTPSPQAKLLSGGRPPLCIRETASRRLKKCPPAARAPARPRRTPAEAPFLALRPNVPPDLSQGPLRSRSLLTQSPPGPFIRLLRLAPSCGG